MRPYEAERGFPENYIARLLKSKEALMKLPAAAQIQRSNVGERPFYPMEALLVELIDSIRGQFVPIDQVFLQTMAHEVYTLLLTNVGPLKFGRPRFSDGWASSFKKYWGIKYFKMMGEAAAVDWPSIAPEVERIKSVVRKYRLNDIYNADESGLHLQTLSNWTLGREKSSGYKAATARVSILFCTNATGRDKRKPLILSEHLPRGFENDLFLRGKVDIQSKLKVVTKLIPVKKGPSVLQFPIEVKNG